MPHWVVITAASAIAVGTYAGGWRIIKTMGTRIIKMDSAQGFAAQGSGAAVILAASHVGFPLSTTHVISGGVMGAGAAKLVSAVRWGVAGNIVLAWIVTIPAAGAIGAAIYGITRSFGANSEAGPVVVAAVILVGIAAIFARRMRRGSPLTAPGVLTRLIFVLQPRSFSTSFATETGAPFRCGTTHGGGETLRVALAVLFDALGSGTFAGRATETALL